jgi:hypothetical protein
VSPPLLDMEGRALKILGPAVQHVPTYPPPETVSTVLVRWLRATLDRYRPHILIYLGGLVLLVVYASAWWWGRKWDHENCLEALKLPSQGMVIMHVCGR